jgi:hypothetical protein
MKILLTICLFISASASFASERSLYDLMYLPKAGTFFGSTDGLALWGKSTTHSDTVGDVADLKYSGLAVQQTVGYSLLDNLFVSASMSYQSVGVEKDVKGGSKDTFTHVGESDPRIDARFRVMDSEYLFDILVGGQIATGDSKSATAKKDGNNKDGGHVANVALEFGNKSQDFQFSTQIGYKHFFEATNKTEGLTTKSNAHSAYNFKGSVQYALTQQSFINPFAELIFTNAYNHDIGSKNSQTTQIDLGAEYKYLVFENLLLRAGIKYTNMENQVTDGIEVREDMILTFLAGANYQF